ncbi:CDP-alcohol phosphatidyltransferase family protein [Aminobacter niigataensis]|uniref:CDP-alcohol phosphatidyltransferase family protein n=1 Tax=Aminobacter niigataensis TaxID=83265 RepID=UPI0024C56B36|nr:phosphatidylcholine/phosphatidylserine synthase [Aminobacter niigataensis]CAI2935528.1 CDP-diacylglycerol--serine O-phosphatidyltransferase [Aminobacter niigataensis]
MVAPFKPFEPHGSGGPRIREIPLRMVLPNLITVLAICAGLSGIRLAFQDRFEPAVVMVLLAAFLDGIDGRLARMLKATSRFGAQMDSLADIVNFGVVPALVLYAYLLDKAGSLGWIATLLFAIAMGLRLARFNVLDEDLDRPAWQAEYFVGVPAPVGAITLMLPMYLGFLGLEGTRTVAYVATGFAILVAFLLVSRLPVYSGKKLSIRREYLLPVMLVAVFYVLLLTVYPWQTLTASVIGYLIFLPLSASAYARRARIEGEKAVAATAEAETTDVSDETKPAS